ncbi:hypothetical protein NGB36_20260 [Streptomyces sp. RB6PN25]|uniref:Secreted protein n=1 Tax=Streptomyces humicola TaxID=2953240 RepID=A0ABT1PYW1_9ACTN|nr:hypothetical protein [Streptomyces humicola]MCQ4082871.1 hypothetical protein [Streptomyces humicola]
MRRGLVQAGAWALATGAAVTLSWFGVRTVLASTAYDPPRALPISSVPSNAATGVSITPQSSSTQQPRPSHSDSPSGSARATPTGGTSAGGSAAGPRPAPSATSPSSSETGTIHSYTVTGGRVALDLGTSSATLVSATPDSGWSMQVWKQPQWIRVDFTSGNQTSSVFCTWNDHPPMVTTTTG